MLIEMSNTAGMHVQDLNEHCLLTIFSNDALSAMDLCSLAETCKRFKRLTQRAFPKEFGIARTGYSDDIYFFGSNKRSKFYNEKDVERILRHFGFRLSTLSINESNQTVVDLVAKHCGNVTLKRLEIHGMKGTEQLQLKSISQRVLGLSFMGCDFFVTPSHICFDTLIELELINSIGCTAILEKYFPNLQRFIFRCYLRSTDNSDNSSPMTAFIGRHKCLRLLTLSGSEKYYNSELIDTICQIEDLEELTLRWVKKPFHIFHRMSLPKLKQLDVNISFDNYNQVIALLQASPSLERLILSCLDDVSPHVFEVLSQMQNLSELTLAFYPFEHIPWKMLTKLKKLSLFAHVRANGASENFLNLIRELENLEELEFYATGDGFVLSESDFAEVVRMVEPRPNVLTLKCDYIDNFDDMNMSKNCDEKVKLINLLNLRQLS